MHEHMYEILFGNSYEDACMMKIHIIHFFFIECMMYI